VLAGPVLGMLQRLCAPAVPGIMTPGVELCSGPGFLLGPFLLVSGLIRQQPGARLVGIVVGEMTLGLLDHLHPAVAEDIRELDRDPPPQAPTGRTTQH
jgi:hypothetical protein